MSRKTGVLFAMVALGAFFFIASSGCGGGGGGDDFDPNATPFLSFEPTPTPTSVPQPGQTPRPGQPPGPGPGPGPDPDPDPKPGGCKGSGSLCNTKGDCCSGVCRRSTCS